MGTHRRARPGLRLGRRYRRRPDSGQLLSTAGHQELPTAALDELEARISAHERKVTEVFGLLALVCDELGVTSVRQVTDDTRPQLKVIPGGLASAAESAGPLRQPFVVDSATEA
jgi:hypothetical protein